MALTATFLTDPDGEMHGKPVYVRGILYLEEAAGEGGNAGGGNEEGSTGEGTDNTEGGGTEPEPTPDSTPDPDPTPDPNPDSNPDTDPTLPLDPDPIPTGYENDGNTKTIGYGELKTLMNIRAGNAESADRINVYKKDTIVDILQFCSNGWLRIRCMESSTGYAYVSNENGIYATVGRDIYTVKEGDTFKTIAAKTLGDENRYGEIKALNGMKDNVLSVGLVLLIP